MPEFDSTLEYRDIPNYPGYKVGNDGTVWSAFKTKCQFGTKWKLKKQRRDRKNGRYLVVTISTKKKQVRHLVHCLVLTSFIGPRPHGMQACHFPDICGKNNNLCNLRWDTVKGNHADKMIHGTHQTGESHGSSKLTEAKVAEALRRYAGGESQDSIGKSLGVCQKTISLICLGKIWKTVPRLV